MTTLFSENSSRLIRHALSYSALLLVIALPAPLQAMSQDEIVCIRCHGALEGKLGTPVKLWKGSIHAENGIACNNCHGGDPMDAVNAMSPGRGFLGAPKAIDIPAFCGRCHVGVKNNYLQSAHGLALGKGGPTCVTCHGNHAVIKASLDIINEKNCAQCHSFERARIIRETMRETESHIASIDGKINQLKGKGIDTEKLEKGLFAARNRFHSLSHTMNADKLRNESAGINVELSKLEGILQGIAGEQAKRRIIGAFAVGLALIAALLFHLLRKSYDEA
ncbi:MAG: cytochrome C [Geobacteraceae bacterium]